jgi:hypothetical protein
MFWQLALGGGLWLYVDTHLERLVHLEALVCVLLLGYILLKYLTIFIKSFPS